MDYRRSEIASRRARLKAEVNEILRISNIPLLDVIREEILPRLPLKTLLRFKAVARDWNSLISVPIFRHLQSRTNRTASGVFQRFQPNIPGVSAYLPFDPLADGIPDPHLSFLPMIPPFEIIASCNGLLCCIGKEGSYFVCNPSAAEWTGIPSPTGGYSKETSFDSLVFEPSIRNIAEDYWLVRASQKIDDCRGVFGFQVFSSATGEWRISSEICAVENLVQGSGVSVGGLAYWRTTMQTVLSYDPANDSCSVFPWPKGNDPSPAWQLGEIDGRLRCTCVTDSAVEVYSLASPAQWALSGSFEIVVGKEGEVEDESATKKAVLPSKPRPLRFQSGEPEVLLWVPGRVFGLNIASGKLREVSLPTDQSWTSLLDDHVPHISSFARVKKFYQREAFISSLLD